MSTNDCEGLGQLPPMYAGPETGWKAVHRESDLRAWAGKYASQQVAAERERVRGGVVAGL